MIVQLLLGLSVKHAVEAMSFKCKLYFNIYSHPDRRDIRLLLCE